MNRSLLLLSVIMLYLLVLGKGDEAPSQFLEAATGVNLSASWARFLDGREVVLLRDLAKGESAFRGPEGIPATDVVA